jgi:hypothetical protein
MDKQHGCASACMLWPGPAGRISLLLKHWHRVTISISMLCYVFVSVQLDALLTRHVPDMELLSRAGGEVAYRLPKGDASRYLLSHPL